MREPAFWYRDRPGLRAQLLRPVGALYAAGTARRLAQGLRERVDVPVISVGNVNVGGSGKTPTVIALLEQMGHLFQQAHVVTRGYGGSLEGPVRVDPTKHTAAQVGDEALLLAAFGEVWVAKARQEGARAAVAAGATAIILDDAHQNPALAHDLSILVVDAARGFGNGLCLPAGPLREPVAVGLSRADIVLSIGADADQKRLTVPGGVPRVEGVLKPLQTGMAWQDMPVFAFAGIGHPEKFFATLRSLGARILHAEALSDHQPLTPALMTRLEADARSYGAQLVTTEKDAVRLPQSFRTRVITLPVRLQLPDNSALTDALAALFQD